MSRHGRHAILRNAGATCKECFCDNGVKRTGLATLGTKVGCTHRHFDPTGTRPGRRLHDVRPTASAEHFADTRRVCYISLKCYAAEANSDALGRWR